MRNTFLALTLISAGAVAAQTVSFSSNQVATPASFLGYTQAVAMGDFNGDGKPDLALVTNAGPSHPTLLMILLGRGDGSFRDGTTPQITGQNAQGVVVADFNGDGKQDLAIPDSGGVGNTPGGVVVLLGNGDGTFQTPMVVPVANGVGGLAVGDFNKDGKPDMAVPLVNSSQIAVLLGKGDGTFQPPALYSLARPVSGINTADFNRDGNLDLAVTGAAGVSVLLGNGDGTFGQPANFPAGTNPGASVIGDFNHDGKPDLAVADSAGGFRVLLGNGDGTFQPAILTAVGKSPSGLAAADFDVDGNVDVALIDSQAAAGATSLAVMRGNGDGTFQPPAYFGVNSPTGIAVGDLNKDNRPDLAVSQSGQPSIVTVSVLLNTTTNSPTITGVVNGASFAPGLAPSAWTTIQGSYLSRTTRTWGLADFVNNKLPTALDNVSAKINKLPAYIYYISPTQLNVLAPDDTTTGPVMVEITNSDGKTSSFTSRETEYSPAFFLFTSKYPAAVHTTGVYVGPNGLISGATFAPARPGETIELFATGFGAANPALPAGKIVTTPEELAVANSVTVTVGGEAATVQWAGVIGSGLDQINVTIPSDLPDGDAELVATLAGFHTQTNLFITVQH